MANTTYKASIKPQFEGVQAQDVSYDLSQPKEMLGELAQGLEQEAKTLQDIALDESQINFNRGAAELVDKYGTDYKGLNGALLELEQKNYNKFGKDNPELAEDLLRQQDAVRLRAVKAARNKYVNENNRKIKEGSGLLLEGFKIAMPDDFANYLYQKTLPEAEQDVDVVMQWENNIAQMDMLLNRRDMNGNYIFSESDRKNRAGLNAYKMQGAKIFVSGMDSEQLKNWDENTFQNEKAFRDMTGFDKDEYDKLDTYVKNRRIELDKDDKRAIKTQSMFNTADLLKNGNDQAKIDELRKDANAPKKLVEKAVELNDKIIKTHWYNPDKDSDPSGAFEAIAMVGEIANDKEISPDAMEKKIEKGIFAIDTMVKNAAETNMSDKELYKLRDWIADSITDEGFAKNIRMLDATPWINSVVEALRADMVNNFASYEPKAREKFESDLQSYHAKGKLTPLEKKAESSIIDTTKHGWIQRERTHRLAYNNAKMGLYDVMDYLRETGNIESAKNMLNKVKYDYIKTYNSDWIPESDFDRLQEEFDSGKKPTYFHNGVLWEYQGYQNDGAIFKVKL